MSGSSTVRHVTARKRSAQSRSSELLNEVRDDKTIKAVVLRIDSPGRFEGLASDIIWRGDRIAQSEEAGGGFDERRGGFRRLLHRLQRATRSSPQPSTITGSIGVVGGKPVIKGFYDWIGVTNEYVLRGTNAGMFRESEKFTDSERAKFEEFLKTTYDDFTPKVAKGRSKDQDLHRLDRSGPCLDRPARQRKRTGR